LLRPVRPPVAEQLVQLELADQGQDVDGRRGAPTGRRWIALKLSGSYLYINNEGTATFGVQNNIVISPTPLPINNFDNSKQQYFNLKATWNYSKNWSFTGGYSYLMYKHNDFATDGIPVRAAVRRQQRRRAVSFRTSPKSTSLELSQRLRRCSPPVTRTSSI
jgi:hypothetical protein